jgi:large subunit ribosomal protein L9
MKVILRTDITNVGRQGDVRDVTAGFARNYLLPRRLVMEATPQNMKLWEREKVKLEKERETIIDAAKETAAKIEKLALSITVKVGDSGKLFGSVTTAHIGRLLEENGFAIERHAILLSHPIKEVGAYTMDVRLHPEVVAQLKLAVIAEKSSLHEAAVEETVEPAAPETPAAEK